jgi:guanylate kinase
MATHSATRGRLVLVSAPSGAGKTSLVKAVLRREPRLRFSISYTTRRPRPHETDGKDYFFVDDVRFDTMASAGEFLEYARVFDNWYGTGRRHVEDLIERGYWVLLEIDWQGARQIRRRVPEALSIFVVPPSLAELEQRLRGRATDSEAVIARRLRDALDDIGHWSEFDYVIINDDFETAVAEMLAIVRGTPTIPSAADERVAQALAEIVGGASPGA